MGYEARGARCEVRVRGVLLPILLEQIIDNIGQPSALPLPPPAGTPNVPGARLPPGRPRPRASPERHLLPAAPPHLPLAIAIEPVLEAHRPVELLSARSPGTLL